MHGWLNLQFAEMRLEIRSRQGVRELAEPKTRVAACAGPCAGDTRKRGRRIIPRPSVSLRRLRSFSKWWMAPERQIVTVA